MIEDRDANAYRPDFVVETKTEKLILEPKQASQVDAPKVQRKAEAAVLWCHIATEHHAKAYGGERLRYAPIPDNQIAANSTLAGLLSEFTELADMKMLERVELRGPPLALLQARGRFSRPLYQGGQSA